MELFPKERFFKSRQLNLSMIIHYFEQYYRPLWLKCLGLFFPTECYFWVLFNIKLSAIKKWLDGSQKNATESKKSA